MNPSARRIGRRAKLRSRMGAARRGGMARRLQDTHLFKLRRPKTILGELRTHRLIDLCRALCRFAIARMRDTQLQEVASSMTLTSLLSLVPLLAVSLAAFAAFPSFAATRQALENAVFNSFLPPQYSEEIVRYLREFTSHASGLGAFGLGGLSLTGLLMIDKFFVTVNRIFKVRSLRPWPQRALIYWAMLTLGPVVMALSITMSTQAIRLAVGATTGSLPGWTLTLGQLVLQSIGYAVLFKFVPNCRVPFSHAFAGGFFVAAAGQIVKAAFEIYVTAGTLTSIYGAFVAFPVFLLWLYLAWFLVFSGAAVTATIPLLTSGRFADSYRIGNDFLTGVALLRVLAAARLSGVESVPAHVLASEVDSWPQAVERILMKLADAGYCGEIRPVHKREEAAWTLLCDPQKKTLREAVYALLIDPANTLVSPERRVVRREEGQLHGWFRELVASSLVDRPIVALVDEESGGFADDVEGEEPPAGLPAPECLPDIPGGKLPEASAAEPPAPQAGQTPGRTALG